MSYVIIKITVKGGCCSVREEVILMNVNHGENQNEGVTLDAWTSLFDVCIDCQRSSDQRTT